jgi:tetratricopeptide (TPR) repeat protein
MTKKKSTSWHLFLGKTLLLMAVSLSLSLPVLSVSETSWQSYSKAANMAFDQGQASSAEDLYRKALAEAKKHKAQPLDIAHCLNALAATLCLQDKTEEARKLYEQSLLLMETAVGKNNPQIVQTMLDLGSVYESEGNHKAAMSLYNRVFAINQRAFGADNVETGKALHRMAKVAHASEKQKDAQAYYKKAVDTLAGSGSKRDLEACLLDYQRLLKDINDSEEARLVIEKLSEISSQRQMQRSVVGTPDANDNSSSFWQLHLSKSSINQQNIQTNEEQNVLGRAQESVSSPSSMTPMYNTLADVYNKQNRYNEAEPLYKTIIAIDEKSLGSDHPSVGADLNNLAALYISQKRYDEAEPLLKRSLTIYQNAYGNDNLLVIKTKSLLASVLNKKGSLADAQALYKNVLDTGLTNFGPNNLETAKALNNLAYFYYQQGKYTEAETTYKWAIASIEAIVGDNDPMYAACLSDYVQVLRKLGKLDEVQKIEQRISSISTKRIEQ